MKQKAFTLIKLLVVIVIIGILATVSVSTLNGYSSKSLIIKYRAQRLQSAREAYKKCIGKLGEENCNYNTIVYVSGNRL